MYGQSVFSNEVLKKVSVINIPSFIKEGLAQHVGLFNTDTTKFSKEIPWISPTAVLDFIYVPGFKYKSVFFMICVYQF